MKRTILVLTLVAVLSGISASAGTAADPVQTVTVDPSTGTGFLSENGAVHIQIPNGAWYIPFNLRYAPNPGSAFSVRPPDAILLPNAFNVEFHTGGDYKLPTLDVPGTLVVKYNLPDLGGRSEATLKMMRLPEDGSTWFEIPSTVDTVNRTVAAQFTLPSSYALAASNFMPTVVPVPTSVPVPAQAPVPTAVPAPDPAPAPAPIPTPAPAAPPAFQLGFATLASLMDIVGRPIEEEHYGTNGDSLQLTTKGLMVWRKADNWTAFTNGSVTWINGPFGLQSRPNSERFDWEAR